MRFGFQRNFGRMIGGGALEPYGGLVTSRWRMTESGLVTPAVLADSVGSNDLTPTLGQALYFAGTTDGFVTDNDAGDNIHGASALTIGIRVKIAHAGLTTGDYLMLVGNGSGGIRVVMYNTGAFYADFTQAPTDIGTLTNCSGYATIPNDQWCTVVFSWDNNSPAQIFIDGVEVAGYSTRLDTSASARTVNLSDATYRHASVMGSCYNGSYTPQIPGLVSCFFAVPERLAIADAIAMLDAVTPAEAEAIPTTTHGIWVRFDQGSGSTIDVGKLGFDVSSGTISGGAATMWAKGSHVGGIRQKGLGGGDYTGGRGVAVLNSFSTTDDTDPGVMVSADEFNAIGDTMTFDFWVYKPTAESVDGCAFASTLDAAAASRRGFIIRGGMASRSQALSGIQFEVYGASTNSHDAYVDAPAAGWWYVAVVLDAGVPTIYAAHESMGSFLTATGTAVGSLTVVSAGDNRLTIGHRVGSVAGRTVDNCGAGTKFDSVCNFDGVALTGGQLLERFLYRRPTATAYPALAASRWTFSEDAGPILDQIGSSDLIPQLTTGLAMDGATGEIDTHVDCSTYSGKTKYTVCGWVRRDFADGGGSKTVFCADNGAANLFISHENTGKILLFALHSGGLYYVGSDDGVSAEGEWVWICIVVDSATSQTCKMYLGADVLAYIQDGTPVTPHKNVSGVGYGGIPISAGNFTFGSDYGSRGFGQCAVSQWMLYDDIPADDDDLAALYRFQKPSNWTINGHMWPLHYTSSPDMGVGTSLVFTSESGTATAYDLSTVADDTGYIRANESANLTMDDATPEWVIDATASHTATGFAGWLILNGLVTGKLYTITLVAKDISGASPVVMVGSSLATRVTITTAGATGFVQGSFVSDSPNLLIGLEVASGVAQHAEIQYVQIAEQGVTSSAGVSVVNRVPGAWVNTDGFPSPLPESVREIDGGSGYLVSPWGYGGTDLAIGESDFTIAGFFVVPTMYAGTPTESNADAFALSDGAYTSCRVYAIYVTDDSPTPTRMIVAEITTYGGAFIRGGEATFDVGDIVHIALVVDRENGPELYINGNKASTISSDTGTLAGDLGTVTLTPASPADEPTAKALYPGQDMVFYLRALTQIEVNGCKGGWA